jgi:hypothetical protein
MSVASLWERRLAYILTLGVIPLYRRNGLGTYLYIYIYIWLAVWLSGCLAVCLSAARSLSHNACMLHGYVCPSCAAMR